MMEQHSLHTANKVTFYHVFSNILASSWGVKDTAAFDITVTSPLSPKIVSEAGGSAGVAARAAESRKHEQNDTKCSELGLQCIPLAVDTYGARGEEACMQCFLLHSHARSHPHKL